MFKDITLVNKFKRSYLRICLIVYMLWLCGQKTGLSVLIFSLIYLLIPFFILLLCAD